MNLNSIFLALETEMFVQFSLLYPPAKVQIDFFVVERNCAIISCDQIEYYQKVETQTQESSVAFIARNYNGIGRN